MHSLRPKVIFLIINQDNLMEGINHMMKAAAAIFLILNLLLLTGCQGEEAQFTFTPSFEPERPVAYTFAEPKPFPLPVYQYKVHEVPLNPKQAYESLKPYLMTDDASKYDITFDCSLLNLQLKSNEYITASLPIFAMGHNLQGEQLASLSKYSQDALNALAWETEDQPYIFTSLHELYNYESATLQARPLTFEYFSQVLFHASDTGIYIATYRPHLKEYPVYRFISRGTEDQAAQNYASFLLSSEGKIISGQIHAEYEVIKEAPIQTELVHWEKAVESVVQYAILDDKRFSEYTINGQNMNLDLRYEVKNVEPCYIVDTNYVALPGWEITLRKLYMNTSTSETIGYRDWIVAINAITGTF